MQITASTNVQAGAAAVPVVSSGAVPTLSNASAAQAVQNILNGGTINARALLPVFYFGANSYDKPGGFSLSVDLLAWEGIDIQDFKSGTSVNVDSPTSHSSVQMEGYLQYNSVNLAPGTQDFQGAVFIGGSYGYSYTSHSYARDYGFGTTYSNGLARVSAGIVISGVAKLAVSRGFGPKQIYIDENSTTATPHDNFKAWSFGITYQSPPPAAK
jgi:hypothetical protein